MKMEGNAAFDVMKGSQIRKDKRTKQKAESLLKPEEMYYETFEGSAGSKQGNTDINCINEDAVLKVGSPFNAVPRQPSKMVQNFEQRSDKVYDTTPNETSIMPSPIADDIFKNCFNSDIDKLKQSSDQEEVDETHSYSTGSVVDLCSDMEEHFSDAQHKVGEVSNENQAQPISKAPSLNKNQSPNSEATDDSDSAQQIEQSKQFFKNFSKMFHGGKDAENIVNCESGVSSSPTVASLTSPMSALETKLGDDSPKAISLISGSDDSFAPIRTAGKKRPNILEDTDSEAERAQNQPDDEDDDDDVDYNINFKRNHERKAKKLHLDDDEQEQASPTSSTSETAEYKSRTSHLSDFEQMMQKKRKEKSKPHGRRLDFITKNDDLIEQLIDQMEDAAYEDRCLNEQGLPATKKVAMLKLVVSQLIKKDLQPLFLEHNILNTLAEWLSPLPSKCLPCLQIRESILHILEDLPSINSTLLKESGIGKTLMFLCKHPQETKKNRECCRRLIAQWARPIYNLSCDYRAMSKAERQERDIELSTRYKKQVAGGKSYTTKVRKPADELEQALCGEESKQRVLRPGEHGWVPRARVPQPSTKDYVHRPQSQTLCQLSNRLRPTTNRYEVLAKKHQNAKRSKGAQHSKVGLSIFGSKM